MKNYIIALFIAARLPWVCTGIEKLFLIAFCAFWLAVMLAWFENVVNDFFRKMGRL